jgi:hypothetical protein
MNTGPSPLAISSISAGSEFLTVTNCPASLAPGSSCTTIVAFAPQALGTRTGNLAIVTNAFSSPDTVSLTGVGTTVSTGSLVAQPDAITFSAPVAVGEHSAPASLSIVNTGNGPATVSSITADGDFILGASCSSIPAGGSCPITVVFAPTATGIRDGMVIVRSNASNAVLAIALEGRGAPREAQATLGATRIAFGNQLEFVASAAVSTSLTNTGFSPLVISRIGVTGNFLQENDCAPTLPPGASCHISLRMFGTFIGPATGELRVESNAAPASLALSGTTCRHYSTLRSQRGLLTCQ